MQKNDKFLLKGYFYSISGATLWGLSGTCGQYLMNVAKLDPVYLTNIRLLIAGIILISISSINNRKRTFSIFKNKKDTMTLVFFSIFGMLLCQLSYLKSIFYTNAPTGTVLQFLSSVFIAIGVCIKDLRLPSFKEVISIFLALFGTFTLATNLNIHNLVINPLGLFWGIFSAFTVVAYTLVPINIIKKYSASSITGFGMLIGGITISLFVHPWNIHLEYDTMMLLALAGIILFGAVISFTFFLKGVSIIGPINGSIVAGIESIASLFFSIVLLNNKFKLLDILGMSLIMAAILNLSLSKKSIK